MAISGGSEATITPLALAGFANMTALSTRGPERASCPFDLNRDGFVMAEGSATLILEEYEHALKRHAKIYAEIVGYGSTDDAYHITSPEESGEGAFRAMVMALESARIDPGEVDYLNAHGTSTPLNDITETKAIKRLFGCRQDLNISSTKSMHGHALGAAGAIEAVATIMAMNNSLVPPTINYETPDPQCDLNYTPNKAFAREIQFAMSNSLVLADTMRRFCSREFHKLRRNLPHSGRGAEAPRFLLLDNRCKSIHSQFHGRRSEGFGLTIELNQPARFLTYQIDVKPLAVIVVNGYSFHQVTFFSH